MRLVLGLPVFNGEKTIEATLLDMFNQSLQTWKLVISDNCSTDSTLEIVKKYQNKDSRIRILESKVNIGSIENFNKVYRELPSDFFVWIPSDDKHESKFLESCIDVLTKDHEAVMCATETVMIDEITGKPLWKSSLKSFENLQSPRIRYKEALRNFPAVAMYGVFKSEFLNRTNLFPKVMGGDLLLMQELAIHGGFRCIPNEYFVRNGRANWNSTNQDYKVFFGDRKQSAKPIYYIPIVMVFLQQLRTLLNFRINFKTKIVLVFELLSYQIRQTLIKIFLRIIKLSHLSFHIRLKLGNWIYWKYMHNPNVIVLDYQRYQERIIKPIIGMT